MKSVRRKNRRHGEMSQFWDAQSRQLKPVEFQILKVFTHVIISQ